MKSYMHICTIRRGIYAPQRSYCRWTVNIVLSISRSRVSKIRSHQYGAVAKLCRRTFGYDTKLQLIAMAIDMPCRKENAYASGGNDLQSAVVQRVSQLVVDDTLFAFVKCEISVINTCGQSLRWCPLSPWIVSQTRPSLNIWWSSFTPNEQ